MTNLDAESTSKSSSEVIEYTSPVYPVISDDYLSISNMHDVILSCQGSNLLLTQDKHIDLQALALINIAYSISPEVIFKDDRLGYVLIWNNLFKNKIRPLEVKEIFYNIIKNKIDEEYSDKKENKIVIDVDKIWNEVVSSDYEKSIELYIDEVFNKIKRSNEIVISGVAPRFVLIMTMYISKSFSHNVSYIDNNNEIVKVTDLKSSDSKETK